MASPFQFVHCSDLHLGSSFRGLGGTLPGQAELLVDAPFRAFENIVSLTLSTGAAFLAISGDVFDSGEPSASVRFRFREGLERLDAAGIPVFAAPGNHDPFPGAWRDSVPYPENLHIFHPDEVSFFPVEQDGTVIAEVGGIGHGSDRVSENLALRFPAREQGRGGERPFRVALLHANIDSDPGVQPYAPAALRDLSADVADYWALGHVHKFRVLREAFPAVVYSGCAQGRAVDEPGAHGAALVRVDALGRCRVEFRRSDLFEFETVTLDRLEQVENYDALFRLLREAVGQGELPRLVRLRLAGPSPLNRELRASDRGELCELFRRELARSGSRVFLESLTVDTCGVYDAGRLEAEDGFAADIAAAAALLKEEGALPARIAALRRAQPGVPAFTEEELEEIRAAARARLLDYLTGSLPFK